MASPGIAVAGDALVWRVGRAPDPWAWVDRSYAGHNRWDDANGVFRTIYAGDSLYACFVELLAYARPDVGLDGSDLLACIVEDPADAAEHPVSAAGALPRDWIQARMVASAKLTGSFADMRSSEMIAALRPQFVQLALRLGYHDFDAAAVKSAQHRALTQQVASYLCTLVTDHGVFLYEASALKRLYLVTRSLDPTGGGRAPWVMRWKPALNAFAITFAGRFEQANDF